MNATSPTLSEEERARLQTALGLTEPLPLPNSQAEEIALAELRHRAEAEAAGDPLVERFARPRKEREAARVLDILDQLERGSK